MSIGIGVLVFNPLDDKNHLERITTCINSLINAMIKSGVLGYISRKSFVFHYGKGGTSSLYKKTGDEKFSGSPVEKNLISDVDLYNKRNNTNAGYWWKKPATNQITLSKESIIKLVKYYDKRDRNLIKNFRNIIKKIYHKHI